jgi:NADH:ubiquinone oxidoreductase subunit B-like Fe-S oxidoreductase
VRVDDALSVGCSVGEKLDEPLSDGLVVLVSEMDGERAARADADTEGVPFGESDTDAEREGDALPIPVDASGPWRADTLVVIGRIPRKLVAPLAAARRQLDTNGLVLAFDSAAEPHPALLSADAVIDVDVLVRGLPPDDDTLRRALDALTTLPVRARSMPAVVEPVVGEAP